ncbi:MAG: hypothetical protein ABI647_24460 [Gemmatimonadota bacterium]
MNSTASANRTAPVLSMVAASLDRADQFVHLVLERKDIEVLETNEVGDAFEVRLGGHLAASVRREDLHVARWDQPRFEALRKRINTNWSIYDTLSSALPSLRDDEQPRVSAQLATRRADLSRDFTELLRLVDRTVGVRLSEHFPLTVT